MYILYTVTASDGGSVGSVAAGAGRRHAPHHTAAAAFRNASRRLYHTSLRDIFNTAVDTR